MSIPDDIRERMRKAGSGEKAQAEGVAIAQEATARRPRAGARASTSCRRSTRWTWRFGSSRSCARLGQGPRGETVTRTAGRRPRQSSSSPPPPRRAQRPPVFRVGLDLVNVTVTVRDGKGGLVSRPARRRTSSYGRTAARRRAGLRPGRRHRRSARSWLSTSACCSTPARACATTCKLSQESAIRFLDAIPRARDLLLVFFDRDIRVSRYNSENQQGIFGRILETKGEGYTALYDAITVYLSRVAGTPGRKVLVLFTDGDDTTSQVPPARGRAARPLERRHDLPGRLPGRAPVEQHGGAPGPLLPLLARRAQRGPRLPADRLARAGRHLPVDPRRAGQRSTCSATSRTTRSATGSSAGSRSRSSGPDLKVRHRPGYDAPKAEPPGARRRVAGTGRSREASGVGSAAGRAATRPCAPARAAASAAPAASRTPRST